MAGQQRPESSQDDRCEGAMKTQGEIEAAICEGITRFEQEYMGRGPIDIPAHLLGDLLVVRLHGSSPATRGRESGEPGRWRALAGVWRKEGAGIIRPPYLIRGSVLLRVSRPWEAQDEASQRKKPAQRNTVGVLPRRPTL